ncbi:pentatricopeptide repeat-containing protein At5g66520 [Amborella trichopoda]|uniref:pentatricopeptide repeat-containing protein At5g66520 n=1 Tax=Amborella trichopoda TaxID=13333 RepID=UPI0005D41937|nr:pentatricopeptide repeat-containing protein At5g66520 [Amborella trichopoda]|eukprot:XP_011624291.1 pentatricopeptide repeat-containing protein At5g66520 [Amborella trichopoda]
MSSLLLPPENPSSLYKPELSNLSSLETCTTMRELKQIQAQFIKTNIIHDTISASRLLLLCCSLSNPGQLDHARRLFSHYPHPNAFMYNTMIRAYSNSTTPEEAFTLYSQMLHHSAPHNTHTFPFLLKACSHFSTSKGLQQIHSQLTKRGFHSEVYALNSLIHAYTKHGGVQDAQKVFDGLLHRDLVSWNSMMDGYVKTGSLEIARKLFNEMPKRNVISWTTMISGYVERGDYKEALSLFRIMQSDGIEPDAAALASMLSACANLGALDQGKWLHAYIDKKKVKLDQVLASSLVDMYAKSGDINEALRVFSTVKMRSVLVWTAMICGLAIHGRPEEAVNLFEEMKRENIRPNGVTFTGVLTACSYAGLVNRGKEYFGSLQTEYGIRPAIEHYGCMVGLLGQAGLVDEAVELVRSMPIEPNSVIWGALLEACRIHGKLDLGERIGQYLIELDPTHGGRYIHLADIFEAAGKWDESVKVRKLMRERGVWKLPGCSLIEKNGFVHEFVAGDKSHPKADEIYSKWEQIAERLRHEGYIPLIDTTISNLEEEDRETVLHYHSEKLAIAFGLINTGPGTTIRVFKNLRICRDCHSVTKLISKVYAREIVVRDRIRFHLFKDGSCSCRDYW